MRINYEEGRRYTIHERGHAITVDQPVDEGGMDAGMKPTELFAGALGACVASYAVAYLRKRQLDATGLRVELHFDMADTPRRIARITMRIQVPAEVGEEHFAPIHKVASSCVIHNSLTHPIDLDTQVGH